MANQEKSKGSPAKGSEDLRKKVEEVLDQIRPAIQMDGGNVQLSDIVDGVVYVQMQGACGCCPASTITLKSGIERIMLEKVPGIKSVESV